MSEFSQNSLIWLLSSDKPVNMFFHKLLLFQIILHSECMELILRTEHKNLHLLTYSFINPEDLYWVPSLHQTLAWLSLWIAMLFMLFILAYSLNCLSYFGLLSLSFKILATSPSCLSPASLTSMLLCNYSSHWGNMLNRIGPHKEDRRNHQNISLRFSNSYCHSAVAGCGTNLTRQNFR